MEAMTELCDLIAENPNLFPDKLSWICTRCPPPQPHSLTPSHLHAVTSLARLLSKCPDPSPSFSAARSALLSFLSSLTPLAFRLAFWPQSSSLHSISLFFSDLLRYLSLAADLSPDFRSDLAAVFGGIVVFAVGCGGEETDIARVFLSAVAGHCPAVSGADAERLVNCLVEWFVGEDEGVGVSSSSENSMSNSISSSMSWGSSGLWKGKAVEEDRDVADDGSSEMSSVRNGGGGEGSCLSKGFEGELVEGLEKMEIAFRLVRRVLDRAGRVRAEKLEVVYKVAAKQLKSLPGFLKVVVRMFFM